MIKLQLSIKISCSTLILLQAIVQRDSRYKLWQISVTIATSLIVTRICMGFHTLAHHPLTTRHENSTKCCNTLLTK